MGQRNYYYCTDPTTYYRKLNDQSARYKIFHPQSWETDFNVARLMERGCSITEISFQIPCSESTVYRAKERIESFLFPGREDASILKQYLENNPPNFGDGDAHSILEMLYVYYGEYNRFDTDSIREGFRKLYQQLDGKSLQEMDPVIYTTSLLCRDHEKAGFVEGVKVGIRIGTELIE